MKRSNLDVFTGTLNSDDHSCQTCVRGNCLPIHTTVNCFLLWAEDVIFNVFSVLISIHTYVSLSDQYLGLAMNNLY